MSGHVEPDERVRSTNASERQRALAELLARGDKAAVESIAAALLASDWPVSGQLADALAEIGGAGAREALIRALKVRRHHVRSAAIKALVRLGGGNVRDHIEKIRNDPAYEVRQDVAAALRDLDDR